MSTSVHDLNLADSILEDRSTESPIIMKLNNSIVVGDYSGMSCNRTQGRAPAGAREASGALPPRLLNARNCASPLSVAVFIAFLFVLTARPQTFEVTGRLDYWSPTYERFKQTFDFRVSVAEMRWHIRLVEVEFQAEDEEFSRIPPDYVEAGSDGTNFYMVTSVESSAPQRARQGSVNPAAFAVQGPGTVPFGVNSPQASINHLWWTYASHRYLKTNNSGRIIDPNAPRPTAKERGVEITNDFRVPARWILQGVAPNLPVLLVASNYTFTRGGRYTPLPTNVAQTNFLLRVAEFESIGAMHLPKRGMLEINYWAGTAMVAGARVRIDGREFKTNLTISSFVPKLPKGSMITDYTGLSLRTTPLEMVQAKSLLRDRWYGEAAPE